MPLQFRGDLFPIAGTNDAFSSAREISTWKILGVGKWRC